MTTQPLNPILQTAIADVYDRLTRFAQDPLFTETMKLVFGEQGNITPQQFLNLLQDLPKIEVRQSQEIGGVRGAFSAQTNTIYLPESLLTYSQSDILIAVLLEQIGHYLDSCLNKVDTKGDEGELFSAVVRGINLSPIELTHIQNEDDNISIQINGQSLSVETAGIIEIEGGPPEHPWRATFGTPENDILTATPADDWIEGYEGNDTIMGAVTDFAIGDTIVGGEGTDTIVMWGGDLSDGLTITTTTEGGWNNLPDLFFVYTFERFDLSDFLGTVNFTGGSIDDWIQFGTNNSLANLSDYVATGDGNDTVGTNLINLQQNDYIDGGNGIDTLVLKGLTNLSNLTINVNNTNHPISGITNATIANVEYFDFGDLLGTVNFTGSANSDGIIFGISSGLPNQSDLVTMGSGDDLVSTSFRNLQQNDVIDGGLGTDTLMISEGNSVSNLVINVNNTINQFSSVTGTQVVNFERFDLSNFLGTLTFTGSNGNDWAKAGNGNDTLDGGLGADLLMGGLGNDTYIVDNIRDSVTENLNEGNDLVQSTVNTTLTNNVENLILLGTANLYGTGNNLDNTLTGNSGANLLKGVNGNDTLLGGGGNDTLIGGLGNDRLVGEGGADHFLFGSASAFKPSNLGVDTLTDFTKNSDKIALSKVTFNALISPLGTLQSAEFIQINSLSNELSLVGSSSAKIVYNVATGNLFYNPDGAITGLSNGSQFAILSNRPNLSATDFFVQA